MNPRINRNTGAPHLHLRERERRRRQRRHRLLRDLLIAQAAVAEVEHLFPEADGMALARKLALRWARMTHVAPHK